MNGHAENLLDGFARWNIRQRWALQHDHFDVEAARRTASQTSSTDA